MDSLLAITQVLQAGTGGTLLDGLGINLVQILAQVVNFLLLMYFLNGVVIQPVMRNLEARRKRVEDSLETARKADERLADVEKDYQARMAEAEADAQQVRADALLLAHAEAARIRAEAQIEIDHMRAQSHLDAQAERNQLLADARAQIVALVMAATHKLIGESLDANRQRTLITDFFVHAPADIQPFKGSVIVTSAVPLLPDEQAKAKADLGAGEIKFEVDPRILGGLIVRIGDKIIDDSVQSKLSALDQHLRS